ncbi:alpha/beta hydrolase-fold protein [Marinactinospora thermotolerans]|uniref:Enterochelin esterase and related enzymes n=1 Tax=Marinactinospora thermotolerans DSM 45154 TaxID=1122192 RepID=A0A1T4LZP4_9ACTN|nr:alpha/beta hydrolase-fold protein [Marinactinospora thermotolerans]SJZ60125.1 Enterochelin esterase and related enzymes [Marinactinospora thermotolerans DSM 45154]
MPPWSSELAGRIERGTIVSDRLRGNPLGDPHERPVEVYLPPGYDNGDRRYPVVHIIQGFTGHIGMWHNRTAFRTPFPELADAMFARGDAPPAILVYVDAWTSLGGSQYLDSPGTGAYSSYLCDEVVAWVDARYRTIPDRDHRAIAGKSSGGYGAMVTAMLRPDVFGALATHAGDALFDVAYQPNFAQIARTLRDSYDGSYASFLSDVRSRPFGTRAGDAELIEMYAYAAAYSAEPDGTVLMPFDEVGRIVPSVWRRWLDRDPVRMAEREPYTEALRSMRAIWIDAGRRDEWYLDLGAQAFREAVAAAGVPEERVHFELFDAGHAAIEYRYAPAVGWLLERIAD